MAKAFVGGVRALMTCRWYEDRGIEEVREHQ